MGYAKKKKQKLHPQLAVALKHNPGESGAPRVVASGAGLVAQNILKQAQAAEVPIHRDSHLASLLADLEIQQEIPQSLYEVVARVLAFIYRVDGKVGS